VYKGPARELLRKFKYGGRDYLAGFLSRLLICALNNEPAMREADAVVPVPLHWTKRLTRGYNQSELLARETAAYLGKPVLGGVLVRKRMTSPQFHLSKGERLENLRGCFKVKQPSRLENMSVLLVDDICTTAATLEQCARVLKKAGASKVYGLTVARDL
jgi:competence protein ComFC